MKRLALLAALIAAPALADVSIQIAASGHATVPVEGSFGVRQFVFDTGAEGSAVYANFADDAGLKATGTEELQGQTGTADVQLISVGRLALDGSAKDSIDAVRLDPRADGVPLAGIVGLDLFGDRTVDFDLPRKRLALFAPGQRPEGLAGPGISATPTTGNLLTIPVRIGTVTATAVIDTGARKTRINWKLGNQLGINPDKIAKGDTIQGATNTAIETGATRVADVHLGDRVLTDAPVLVADLPVFEAFGVADRPAIILGLDWLDKTRMVIDFPGRLIWFEAHE
ncbi:aspartyl protease family protein [Sphingomonas sp. G124]|uniref:Aspartyl protease family protein n=1 Tax=Sphingomonas cremea TaxID=2904799 RepID=A0A9X1U5S0_9SPHN|nr:aspartyl protease family protein [Sphingomonas cremea]MCF2515456.1 aspartyl protease family protein [Sphingomonas cremea]